VKTLAKPDPKARQRPVEILLVEDNPGDVNLLEEAFKSSRFPIHLSVVQDGEQALNFLRRKNPYFSVLKPDLILLDLNLPRKNGHLLKPLEWSQYGVLLNYLEENWMRDIRLDLPPGILKNGGA
jgi:hypothetical protein